MNRACFHTFPAFFALLLTGATLQAQQPADQLIAQGDVFYFKLQAAEALKYYLPAEQLDPNNVRLLVHISREYRHLMSDADNLEEKIKLGGTALGYAKRAATLDPKDPGAQLAVAISCGKLQPFQSNREKIQGMTVVKTAADKAIRLDPNNDLSWHILGRWHKGVAEISPLKRALALVTYGKLPDSTFEEAAKCFEKAMALNPNRLMHYIELGQVYAEMGRTDEARRLISQGLAMQNTEKDDPETKQQGREVLAKLH
jgi:tetratricopeptide (TPR) repeat protein